MVILTIDVRFVFVCLVSWTVGMAGAAVGAAYCSGKPAPDLLESILQPIKDF